MRKLIKFSILAGIMVALWWPLHSERRQLRSYLFYGPPVQNIHQAVTDEEWHKFVPPLDGKYTIIKHIRANTSKDAVFLVFRQSDFAFYANRRYINHSDPRMLDVYSLESTSETFLALKNLGIDYIFTPSYAVPTIYNSKIAALLADPAYVNLELAKDGYRLFRLRDQEIQTDLFRAEVGLSFAIPASDAPSELTWVVRDQEGFLLPITMYTRTAAVHPFNGDFPLTVDNSQYRESVDLITSDCGPYVAPNNCFSRPVFFAANQEYLLDATGSGLGNVEIRLFQYDKNGGLLDYTPIWTGVLDGPPRPLKTLFRPDKKAAWFRLSFRIDGRSTFHLHDINFYTRSRLDNSVVQSRWSALLARMREPATPIFIQAPATTASAQGWNSYVTPERATWPWGITSVAGDLDCCVYLEQVDDKNYWLHTGDGPIVSRPSRLGDNRWKLDRYTTNELYFAAEISGEGVADLYVWWFDYAEHYDNRRVAQIKLPNQYQLLSARVDVPESADEVRFGLFFRENTKRPGTIIVKDAMVGYFGEISTSVLPTAMVWQWPTTQAADQIRWAKLYRQSRWLLFSENVRSFIPESPGNQNEIFAEQVGDNDLWLTPGLEELSLEPFNEVEPDLNPANYFQEGTANVIHVTGTVRSDRRVEIYLWRYFDEKESTSQRIATLHPPTQDPMPFDTKVLADPTAKYSRIAFLLREEVDEPGYLAIENASVKAHYPVAATMSELSTTTPTAIPAP